MPSGASRQPRKTAGEFELIQDIHRRFGTTGPMVIRGIGDDAAIIKSSAGRWQLLTTDLLIEGVHFTLDTATFKDIGYRAAVANLSDIAAMGGLPQHLLVALAVPPSCTPVQIQRLYQGIMKACRPHGVQLIGGDTSASQTEIFLAITLTGRVEPQRALTRSGARPGDLIYVTGTLGDSYVGLQLLMRRRRKRPSGLHRVIMDARQSRYLIGRHLRPSARVHVGRLLATHRIASAAIDLSDGLSGDLRHVCTQSGTGAEINAPALPISSACRAYADACRIDPIQFALRGGEDYELLFTVPAKKQRGLHRLVQGLRGIQFTCIGLIKPHPFGMRIRSAEGSLRTLDVTSYDHFRTKPISARH
ncbi:MAG: thiamine-phosphate kinase [Nitrospiraceae bacterium]